MEDETTWPPAFKTLSSSACSTALVGSHATYNVGPGKTYTELTQVPWLSLVAGDVVNIYYRAAAYKTKIGLRAQGTAAQPVYINGVTDSSCNRPIIDGDGAVMADDAKAVNFGGYGYSNGVYDDGIQGLGLFIIYWTGTEMTDARNYYVPKYITIQNLKLMNANVNKQYTNSVGVVKNYAYAASGIYAVRVQHLSVENCEITANGNGVFTNTRGGSTSDYSSYFIARRNKIYGNGNASRSTEHNLYIQGKRSLYEGNYLGQAYGGSTVKDRSSASVFRYNYIQSSARALDLVESEEEYYDIVKVDPLYNYAWVYGNVIINDINLSLGLSARPIHFGHDNTTSRSRKGTLFFYGNTYVQRSTSSTYYYSTVFQVGGNDDDYPDSAAHVEASGNVFWSDNGTTIWRFLSSTRTGRLVLKGTNYIPTGWDATEKTSISYTGNSTSGWTSTGLSMVDTTGNTAIVGDTRSNAPALNSSTLAPTSSSPFLNKGIAGPSTTPTGATAANLTIQGEYTSPLGVKARVLNGSAWDLGAFELP
jgi:hypothetical protein